METKRKRRRDGSRAGSAAALTGAAALAAAALALGTGAARAEPPLLPAGPGQCLPAVFGTPPSSETCAATLARGRAVPPRGAPAPVKAVIQAANRIGHRPYIWGGGHLRWRSLGYDCSGAVSYALHGGGLLGWPLVSGQLESWGESGPGRWITVYANPEHVYMVVAGLRYDTRDDPPGVSGPRWHRPLVPRSRAFVARHPAGL